MATTRSTVCCDGRPVRRVTGEWRGYYTFGFESSDFVPCTADRWTVASDSIAPNQGVTAWVTLSDRAAQHFDAPPVAETPPGYPRYFVRWRGTVTGPDRYGHMGLADFEIEVDKILEIRAPGPNDCTRSPAKPIR